MLKSMLFNILLKRGASAFEEWLGKVVRHGASTYGGYLLANGLTDSMGLEAIIGGAVAVSGIAVSIVRIYIQKKL